MDKEWLKIGVKLEYNGLFFRGWQSQSTADTVQDELDRAIKLVLRLPANMNISLRGAGRTDAGVHAREQVASFLVPKGIVLDRLLVGVNGVLKGKIAIRSMKVMPDKFDPRRSHHTKRYKYTIYYSSTPPVLDRDFVWHIYNKLDIEKMKREACKIQGTYNFKSFQASGCQAKSVVRTILSSTLQEKAPYLIYTIEGNGFLKQMVRIIVGTLVDIGKGKISSITEVLEKQNRVVAGQTAPAKGLCLDKIVYNDYLI